MPFLNFLSQKIKDYLMKLHLGCGKRYIGGYIHIDAIEYPHIDHVSTIDHLSFIPDSSIDIFPWLAWRLRVFTEPPL